ncbi:MAG: dihydroorotase [Verrucomicrobiota bacterium]|nr:dihydroorotase [Verrucomicrobiota bacterium]
MRTLIKNGIVARTELSQAEPLDILIDGGHVKQISRDIVDSRARVIDARGKLVAPGLVDVHVHFREPGQEHKEDIRSGSRAAAAGGFTAVVTEPNTIPPIDTPARVRRLLATAREKSIVRFYTKAAITVGMNGEKLADIAGLKRAGARAISDDGHPVPTARLMQRALEQGRECDILASPHCEESQMHREKIERVESGASRKRFPRCLPYGRPGGPPYTSEDVLVKRDIELAEKAGARVHISHVSLAKSVEIIAAAKKRGVRVTAEATPHHFLLTADDAERIGPNAKANPPLRTRNDVAAVRQGLRDGTIDVIASDHAPHSSDDKNRRWDDAPFGVIGLETTLGLALTCLVRPDILTLMQAIEKLTIAPARIFGLDAEGVGSLAPGASADVVIIDPDREWKVDAKEFHSKGRNCPFDGLALQGKAVITMVEGKIVARDGKIVAERRGS